MTHINESVLWFYCKGELILDGRWRHNDVLVPGYFGIAYLKSEKGLCKVGCHPCDEWPLDGHRMAIRQKSSAIWWQSSAILWRFNWYNRNIFFPKTSLCSHQCNSSCHFDFQQLESLCCHPIQPSHHWRATMFVIKIDQSDLQLRNHYHRWQFQVQKPHWSKSKLIRFHFQVWSSTCQMIFEFPNFQLGNSKTKFYSMKKFFFWIFELWQFSPKMAI